MRLFLVLAFLLVISSAQAEENLFKPIRLGLSAPDFSAVYDGEPMTATDYGFTSTVYVRFDGGSCSGTLIAPDLVLTAAHCVEEKPMYVAFWNGQKLVDPRRVIRYKAHEKYTEKPEHFSDYADIALLRLESSVPAGYRSVPLLSDPNLIRGEVTVQGLGRSGPNGRLSGLTQAKMHTVSTDSQHYLLRLLDPRAAHSVCVGDSGGPVYLNVNGTNYLAGVISFIDADSKECVSGEHSTYAMIITNHLAWIQNTSKEI